MKVLELKDINKYYKAGKNTNHVLKNINISFQKGELTAIIGESGSGKSTLLNIMGMLDSEFTGHMIVNDKDIKKFKKKEIDAYRKNKVGFIFQSFNLIPHLSVLDNVVIPMTLNGVSKKKRIKKGKEILERLGLAKEIHKKPSALSGGQKQRVSIARALVNDPDIIIADEPTGSLDSKNTDEILSLLKEVVKMNKLVIMVTHSEKVAKSADRLIEIRDGEIVSDTKKGKLDSGTDYTVQKNSSKSKEKNRSLSLISAIKLSLINMKEKIFRNILISFGTSIGIMSVILMLAFGNGIKTYFNNTMNSYSNPSVIEVSMNDNDDSFDDDDNEQLFKMPKVNDGKTFTEGDLEKLKSLDDVSGVEKGYNQISVGANSIQSDKGGCNLMRIASISSILLKTGLTSGDFPKSGEVLINRGTLDKLGYDANEIVGKKVKLSLLIGDKKVKNDFTISGVYDSYGSLNSMLRCAFLNYEDLAKIYSENKSTLNPNIVYVTASDDKYVEQVKNEIKDLGYSSSSEEQMTIMFNQMINIITYGLSGIAAISLIVSSIMILVVLYISVIERTKEIGILKSIGARRKDIRRIFLSEASLIGLFSGLLGCGISYGLAKFINKLTYKSFSINLVLIDKRYLLYGLALSVVISIIAGMLPAMKAATVDPVKSLRRE
ncbi:MAG TPA: ABC transporter ATP-binding protein [Clostridium sp.]|nr:ABC transporter ATP-binding protein [Clostridium sp.]